MSQSNLERWLSTLRSEKSSKTYRVHINLFLKDVMDTEEFLLLAQKDKKAVEELIIDRILVIRDQVAGATCKNYYAAARSFLLYYDIELSWRKIGKILPRHRIVASDRCPTVDEIRKLLSICVIRDRAIVFVLVSGGFRVGSFEWLNFGDYSRLESGIGRLVIYRGFPEEYVTFVTPEACDALERSFEERVSEGEKILFDSPLFRHACNMFTEINPHKLQRLDVGAIQAMLCKQWIKSGVRVLGRGKGKNHRAEFKAVHGFRKFFKTRTRQVMNNSDVEVLIGHFENYYKPEEEKLAKEYLKAVPLLTISEVEEVRREGEKKLSLKDEQLDKFERRLSSQDLVLAQIQQRLEEIDGSEA